ncbi:hypothetical protein VPHK24_0022 [Vibrio phage K24]|nr:hypothetical protein SIPHO078v2_p0020 [Vibrio phage 14E30.1]
MNNEHALLLAASDLIGRMAITESSMVEGEYLIEQIANITKKGKTSSLCAEVRILAKERNGESYNMCADFNLNTPLKCVTDWVDRKSECGDIAIVNVSIGNPKSVEAPFKVASHVKGDLNET